MRRSSLAALLLALAAACAVQERTRPTVPPLVEPDAFRIETVLFDVPLDVAEDLFAPALERDATIAVAIDETGLFARIEERARADARIVRADRPDFVVAAGTSAAVPARAPDSAGASGSRAEPPLASDALDLVIGAAPSVDWAPVEIEIALDWRSDRGRRARLPGSRTLLPARHRMTVVCLPAREGASVEPPRAVIGFVGALGLLGGAPLESGR